VKRLTLAHGALIAVALAVGAARDAVAQDSPVANLARVGTELARFNKPGALYGYVRDYQPAYFAIADKAGLADLLDGKIDSATFKTNFATQLAAAKLDPTQSAAITAEETTFSQVATTLETTRATTKPVGLSANEIKSGSPADVVKDLRSGLYDAKGHWISSTWSADKAGSVGVKFVPGTLGWFNPAVSIPELGIKAGVPLTDAQKSAVVQLFSFDTVPNTPATADGTAAFPSHVGRALNPNSNVLTVLNDKGEVISDLVVKGGGPNVPNATRDGRLDASEAYMDSELARNLYNAGVKNYDALAVVIPDAHPDKGLIIRAPRTMLRQFDLDKTHEKYVNGSNVEVPWLTDAELKATLEHVTHEAAIREGLASMSVGEWLKTYLPRTSGENWGLLSGLGVEHGSPYTRDNHGLAETVDWGMAELHLGGAINQTEHEWENVEKTISRVNEILPDAEKVVVADAKKIFDAAFEMGKTKGLAEKIKFDPKMVDKMSDGDLRTLAKNLKDPADPNAGNLSYSAPRSAAVARLTANGNVMETVPFETLAKLPAVTIASIAKHNGITLPANGDRADMIAAIEGRSRASVVSDLAKAGVTEGVVDATGFSERLREIVKDHATAGKDATDR
jgi:hypothetical protein